MICVNMPKIDYVFFFLFSFALCLVSTRSRAEEINYIPFWTMNFILIIQKRETSDKRENNGYETRKQLNINLITMHRERERTRLKQAIQQAYTTKDSVRNGIKEVQ